MHGRFGGSSLATVRLEHVSKTFAARKNTLRAVDDLTLSVADGEFVVIAGPSGCGKTTSLRLIAGLERLTSGTIHIADRDVTHVSPRDRDVAMVFQNYALYPHMTVEQNIAFGLRMRGMAGADIQATVREMAELLSIAHLLQRKPDSLSGGERQRAALARALVRKPLVFLLDEPLANLDAWLRRRMRAEIKTICRDFHTTMLYVTHDQEEAMALADRLVIMKDGAVQQYAAPATVYDRPANRFVAGFIGTPSMNFLGGSLEREGKNLRFVGSCGKLALPRGFGRDVDACHGRQVVLGIRPQHVHPVALSPDAREVPPTRDSRGSSVLTDLTVRAVEPLGDCSDIHLWTAGGESVVARAPGMAAISLGQRISAHFELSHAHFFHPDERGSRID